MIKEYKRKVRTCPMCGNRITIGTLYGHFVDEHENDLTALASHLSKALHKLLNRRKR